MKGTCKCILNNYYVNISRAIREPECTVDSGYNWSMCHESYSSCFFIKQYMDMNDSDIKPFKFRLVALVVVVSTTSIYSYSLHSHIMIRLYCE